MGKTLIGSLARALTNRTPVPYVSSRNLNLPWTRTTGAETQMRAMGSVGTLFAIVNRTSNATAQVTWRLWRKAPTGLPEDRVEVTRHAALDLWNHPNEFMTRQELVEALQQHIDLTGEGWIVISRNARSPLPLELWPVRPDRMEPIPHPVDFLSGYLYRGPGGEQVPLETRDVVFLRTPHPLDPYRGMGAVQTILSELDANRYSAEWNRNFFLNSAEPGGIIEVPNALTDAEFNDLRERWNEQHRGVANAHRVAILEHGRWVDRKYTQRDMQFVELRTASREVIREAFGIPAFALGEVKDVNRATADASSAWFAAMLTVPRLERIKAALNSDLLPLYGPSAAGLEFDYDTPVTADVELEARQLTARANAAKALREAGWDATDVLSAVGLPEMRYTTPAEPAAPRPAPTPVPAPAARLDLHHHTHAAPALAPVASLSMFDLARAQRRAAILNQDADIDAARAEFDSAVDELMADWEPIAEAQIGDLEQQITAAIDDGDLGALSAMTVDTGRAEAILRRALGDMAAAGAEQIAAEAAEQGVTVDPPEVAAGLRNSAPRLWAAFGSELVEVATATAGMIAASLAASAAREALRLFRPGVAGRSIARQVGEFLRSLRNVERRELLAGALHRAQNVGRIAALGEAPPARYLADERRDSNTCPPCAEIDGTEFASLAEASQVYGAGGYLECEGRSRCRGTVRAIWGEGDED